MSGITLANTAQIDNNSAMSSSDNYLYIDNLDNDLDNPIGAANGPTQAQGQLPAVSNAGDNINIREKVSLFVPEPGTDPRFDTKQATTTSLQDTYDIIEKRCNKKTSNKYKDFDHREMMRSQRISAIKENLRGQHANPPAGYTQTRGQWSFTNRKKYTFPAQNNITNNFLQEQDTLYDVLSTKDQGDMINMWSAEGFSLPVQQTPVAPLEQAYHILVQGHIDGQGNHLTRDKMYRNIRLRYTTSIKRDLCGDFEARCPQCQGKFQGRQAGWATRRANMAQAVQAPAPIPVPAAIPAQPRLAYHPSPAVGRPLDAEDSDSGPSSSAPKRRKLEDDDSETLIEALEETSYRCTQNTIMGLQLNVPAPMDDFDAFDALSSVNDFDPSATASADYPVSDDWYERVIATREDAAKFQDSNTLEAPEENISFTSMLEDATGFQDFNT